MTPKTKIAIDPESGDAIGERLRATRLALGMNQTNMALAAGIKPNQYNQWEHGTWIPSLKGAKALCKAFGITLDWIYFGHYQGLPFSLAAKVRTEMQN